MSNYIYFLLISLLFSLSIFDCWACEDKENICDEDLGASPKSSASPTTGGSSKFSSQRRVRGGLPMGLPKNGAFDEEFSEGGGFLSELRQRSQQDIDKTASAEVSGTPMRRRFFEFTPEQQNELSDKGFDSSLITKIEVLQTAMFRSPHGVPDELTSYFSKEELIDILEKLGGDEAWEGLTNLLESLKERYPHKIPVANIHQNAVYTPNLRLVVGRGDVQSLRSCATLTVQSAPEPLFVERERPETSEEREQRKRMQSELFKSLEAERGVNSQDSQKLLEDSENAWKSYLSYVSLRVERIFSGFNKRKITAEEIEDTFKEYLSSYYTSIRFDGCEVFFNLKEVDLERKDHRGITNKELMDRGVAPIGSDGFSMNLHHLTRRHPGMLVLMPESFHQNNTGLLHLRSTQYMRQPAPVDRNIFSRWKVGVFGKLLKVLAPGEFCEKDGDPKVELDFQ